MDWMLLTRPAVGVLEMRAKALVWECYQALPQEDRERVSALLHRLGECPERRAVLERKLRSFLPV